MIREGWIHAREWLSRHLVWLFVALIILPAGPFPTSALLLLAGSVWGESPLMGCLFCLLAIGLNMSWTYWVAAGPGRWLIQRLLVGTRFQIPERMVGTPIKTTVVLRLTPGIPFFLQNYALGVMGVPFRIYLPVSLLCNGLLACGLVLGGAGIGNGKMGPLLMGVSILVVSIIVIGYLRQRLNSGATQGKEI